MTSRQHACRYNFGSESQLSGLQNAEVDRWMAMGKDVRDRYQDVETETTSLRVDLNAFLVDGWIAAL